MRTASLVAGNRGGDIAIKGALGGLCCPLTRGRDSTANRRARRDEGMKEEEQLDRQLFS